MIVVKQEKRQVNKFFDVKIGSSIVLTFNEERYLCEYSDLVWKNDEGFTILLKSKYSPASFIVNFYKRLCESFNVKIQQYSEIPGIPGIVKNYTCEYVKNDEHMSTASLCISSNNFINPIDENLKYSRKIDANFYVPVKAGDTFTKNEKLCTVLAVSRTNIVFAEYEDGRTLIINPKDVTAFNGISGLTSVDFREIGNEDD